MLSPTRSEDASKDCGQPVAAARAIVSSRLTCANPFGNTIRPPKMPRQRTFQHYTSRDGAQLGSTVRVRGAARVVPDQNS